MSLPRFIRSVAVAVGLLLLAPAVARADRPAPSPSQARFEVRFMTEMIDHHMMAVMTAQMCLERAVHQELRTMCEDIVTSQMEEIEMMQSWLREWYGISYEPEMTPGMQRQMEKLAELSGPEFEIEFMTMMIRHHWQAIVKAAQAVDKAYHGELRDLAENIITTQSQEIQQMREWLCEWYGVCRNGPGAPLMHGAGPGSGRRPSGKH